MGSFRSGRWGKTNLFRNFARVWQATEIRSFLWLLLKLGVCWSRGQEWVSPGVQRCYFQTDRFLSVFCQERYRLSLGSQSIQIYPNDLQRSRDACSQACHQRSHCLFCLLHLFILPNCWAYTQFFGFIGPRSYCIPFNHRALYPERCIHLSNPHFASYGPYPFDGFLRHERMVRYSKRFHSL